MDVMTMNGCEDNCVRNTHELSEHSVLIAHSLFASKNNREQLSWILQYFESHCCFDSKGKRDVKKMAYFVQGRTVCQQAWIKILGISQTRFYRLRKDFEEDGGAKHYLIPEHLRLPKTLQTIGWMKNYFEKIGDKRPDKHGIYLPTCLTVKQIFNIMVDDLFNGDTSHAICYSNFCGLFSKDFKHVTIPKVSIVCVISHWA